MSVANQRPEAPTAIRYRSWRNFRLVGIEPLEMADHLAVAGCRGEDVEACGGGRQCRWAVGLPNSGERQRRGPDGAIRSSSFRRLGYDGFWIHRVLQAEGIESHVVNAALIATSRRRRRAKTDGIDGRRWSGRCWPTSEASHGCARWSGRRRRRKKTVAA